jgi:hypothetical protein
MSRKPSTRFKSFSTAALRRSDAGRWPGALCMLAAVLLGAGLPAGGPARLGAQAIELSMGSGGGFLTASLSFRWTRSEEVIASLHRGLESRITFTTRLYEARRPVFSFAGDRVLAEKTVTRSAFWDFLDQVFVVEEDGTGQKTYQDPDELIRGFFSMEETFGYAPSGSSGRPLYLAARAQFEPVRLMPPLTLIGLAGAASTITTPWVRREVP